MSTVVMHNVVSLDGFIADADDQVGPLFDWYSNGDQEIDTVVTSTVSKESAHYVQSMMAGVGALVVGRHVFDMTNGWEGQPLTGDHVVVVSHRPKPADWHPQAPFHFVDDVADAVRRAGELAGERNVAIAAGNVGGQAFALGLVDEVAMDVVPVVVGTGKRYFGSVDAQHLLEGPHTVIQGRRVLHLRYGVRRQPAADGR
ncbi:MULTISPECIES: dihydrofolate reductase family protein [Streptomyces]|uniref:Dihydrofolate reductase n=1 Tax=Streptomyces parvulus TaxID=146923 RepID=A0A191VAS4_9ACTN|nr:MULTISPECIES: dihydrofolate reductase family protein [Streptomyces]ANJ11978.1 dihydrofolate reductase [Streptomyces parvulus]MZD54590.1 dihydrofolate reductase [Streptomyces sp. SID5606]GGS04742.1 deaminase [Streptomyces parvulus]